MLQWFTAVLLTLILPSAQGHLSATKKAAAKTSAAKATALAWKSSPHVRERTESTEVQKLVPNNDRYVAHFKIISGAMTVPQSLNVDDGKSTGICDCTIRPCVVAIVNQGGVEKKITRNLREGLTLSVCVQSLGNGKVVVDASVNLQGVIVSRERGAEILCQAQTNEGRLIQTIPLGETTVAEFGTKDKIRVEVRVERRL